MALPSLIKHTVQVPQQRLKAHLKDGDLADLVAVCSVLKSVHHRRHNRLTFEGANKRGAQPSLMVRRVSRDRWQPHGGAGKRRIMPSVVTVSSQSIGRQRRRNTAVARPNRHTTVNLVSSGSTLAHAVERRAGE